MKKTLLMVVTALVTACPLFAQSVTPQSDGKGLFSLQFANIYFEVDSTYAGRVSSLKVDNQEILFLDRNYWAGPYWGSSFWMSPEDGSQHGVSIDRSFYTGGIAGNKIILTSQTSEYIPAKVIKIYEADLKDSSVTITSRIVNVGTTEFMRAGWEVTRVPPAGSLTFWPTGDTVWGSLSDSIVKNGSFSWYSYPGPDSTVFSGKKYFADGLQGWYGHVTGTRCLFVKKFTEVPFAKQAPGEAELEFWLSADHQYVELENQGAYSLIPPNDSLEYVVKWYLRKLPQNVSVAVGSESLMTYARSVARPDSSAARKIKRFRAVEGAGKTSNHVLRISTGAERVAPAVNRRYTLKGQRVKRPAPGAILE